MESSLSLQDLERYLAWCRDTGQDMAVAEEAVDRFAAASEPAGATPGEGRSSPIPAGPATAPAIAAPDEAQREAVERAAQAGSLTDLRAAVDAFEGCALRSGATHLVFGDGDPAARIFLIGDGPGAEDDRTGRILSGPPGRLLERMLKSAGLRREEVYIANVLPWRPPGSRPPTPAEIAICLPFLERQIELVAPDLILCLGAAPARILLGIEEGIMKSRGVWRDWTNGRHAAKALTTLQPDYLLRQTGHKRLAWRDMRILAAEAAKLSRRA